MNEINNSSQKVAMWPATGVHAGIVDVMHAIGDMVRDRFPKNFFRSVHYNTKDGFMSQYVKVKIGRLKGQEMHYTKQPRPRLVLMYDDRSNDSKETGLLDSDPFIYPMVQGIHPEMHHYNKFYHDPFDIGLYTSDKRIRINIEFLIETDSSSDQENALSYLENTFKMQYGTRLKGINSHYILNNDILERMKYMLFFNQIISVKDEKNEKLKKELLQEIQSSFNNHIARYSYGLISPRAKNGKEDETFYTMDRVYENIYFEITNRPEKTDGEKRGEAFDKFSINMQGFFEIYKPITYLLRSPSVINGHLVDEIMKISNESDKDYNYKPTGFVPYKNKQKVIPFHVSQYNKFGYKTIYCEEEITVDSPKDYIDIIEWLGDEKFNGTYDKYIDLIKSLNEEKFHKYIKISIYEGDMVFDREDYFIENNVIYLNNTDSTKLYSLYIMLDNEVIVKEKKII
jgi:hypothetical protein